MILLELFFALIITLLAILSGLEVSGFICISPVLLLKEIKISIKFSGVFMMVIQPFGLSRLTASLTHSERGVIILRDWFRPWFVEGVPVL